MTDQQKPTTEPKKDEEMEVDEVDETIDNEEVLQKYKMASDVANGLCIIEKCLI